MTTQNLINSTNCLPGVAPMAGWGGGVSSRAGASGNVTFSTPATINYSVPAGADNLTMQNRTCAFGSGHPGGSNFAFADGSARFVADDLPLESLQGLSTRAAEEVVAHRNA